MFRTTLFLFIFWSNFVASSPIYTEVWTIDEGQKEQWEAFLFENGVTSDYIEQVFSSNKVARIQFGPVAAQGRPSIPAKSPDPLPHLVWENEHVEVYIAEPQVPDHLLVALKRPVEHLSDVTEDEYLEMRKVVRNIQAIMREQLQKSTCLMQCSKAREASLASHFVIEIRPPSPDSTEVFNQEDKAYSNLSFLYKEFFPASLPKLTTQEIEEMALFWRLALQRSFYPFSDHFASEPLVHSSTPIAREAEAIALMRNGIFQLLEERFSIKRETTKELIQPSPSFLAAQKQCTFCRSDLLQRESVYESEFSYILYNYKPSSSAHFLILPKRHVRSSEDLREDELRDLYAQIQLLLAVLQGKCPTSDVFVYTQDDPSVAQKVPHTHTHLILEPPSKLRFLLFSINYTKEPTLNRKEMEPLLVEFQQRIQVLLDEKSYG